MGWHRAGEGGRRAGGSAGGSTGGLLGGRADGSIGGRAAGGWSFVDALLAAFRGAFTFKAFAFHYLAHGSGVDSSDRARPAPTPPPRKLTNVCYPAGGLVTAVVAYKHYNLYNFYNLLRKA